jgi:hypothetical protein
MPLETLSTGRGDCEDCAIAKYIARIRAGLRREDVRCVLLREDLSYQNHAAVAARLNDEWIILNNRLLTIPGDISLHGTSTLFVLDHTGLRRFVRRAEYRRRSI